MTNRQLVVFVDFLIVQTRDEKNSANSLQ